MTRTALKCLMALLMLAGCSDTPTLHYYQLTQPVAQNQPLAPDAPVLVIEPIMLADFLDTSALVLQRSDVELVRAQYNVWVEPLASQLGRNLRGYLQQQLPQVRIASQTPTSDAARLLVQVDQFHGSEDGQVRIKVRYSLLYKGKVQQFDYQSQQPQADEGYSALVTTLSQGWQQLASDIQQHIGPALAR